MIINVCNGLWRWVNDLIYSTKLRCNAMDRVIEVVVMILVRINSHRVGKSMDQTKIKNKKNDHQCNNQIMINCFDSFFFPCSSLWSFSEKEILIIILWEVRRICIKVNCKLSCYKVNVSVNKYSSSWICFYSLFYLRREWINNHK